MCQQLACAPVDEVSDILELVVSQMRRVQLFESPRCLPPADKTVDRIQLAVRAN